MSIKTCLFKRLYIDIISIKCQYLLCDGNLEGMCHLSMHISPSVCVNQVPVKNTQKAGATSQVF